jgi:hypothetical protein
MEISLRKVVHIIYQSREQRVGEAELRAFIAALNEDEKANLVALAWIGRETFDPDEWDEAVETARTEASTPTEDYLMGMPRFTDYLEDGLEKLGISPTDEEEHFL